MRRPMVLTVANFRPHDEDEEKHVLWMFPTLLTSDEVDHRSLRLSRCLRSDHLQAEFQIQVAPLAIRP